MSESGGSGGGPIKTRGKSLRLATLSRSGCPNLVGLTPSKSRILFGKGPSCDYKGRLTPRAELRKIGRAHSVPFT